MLPVIMIELRRRAKQNRRSNRTLMMSERRRATHLLMILVLLFLLLVADRPSERRLVVIVSAVPRLSERFERLLWRLAERNVFLDVLHALEAAPRLRLLLLLLQLLDALHFPVLVEGQHGPGMLLTQFMPVALWSIRRLLDEGPDALSSNCLTLIII